MNPGESLSDAFAQLSKAVKNGQGLISLSGLTSTAAKAFVVTKLRAATGKRVAVLTATNSDLDQWTGDITFWQTHSEFSGYAGDSENNAILPAFETDFYAGISPHAETLEKRALALWRLATGEFEFALLSARAMATRVYDRQRIKKMGANLKRDSEFEPGRLIERLSRTGYKLEDPIANIGEYSLRGGIVDVWPPNSELPLRIEFFGDTVDSIRTFDPETQLSVEQVRSAILAPMSEFNSAPDRFVEWAEAAAEEFDDEHFARNLSDRTEFASEGEAFSGWEFQLPLIDPLNSNVFDFIEDTLLVIDEPSLIEQDIEAFYDHNDLSHSENDEHGEIGLEPQSFFLDSREINSLSSGFNRIELRGLGRLAAKTDEDFATENKEAPLFLFPTAEKAKEFEIQSRASRKFKGKIDELANILKTEEKEDPPHFVFQTEGLAERFSDILRDYDFVLKPESVALGELSGGFEIPAFSLEVFSETDLFGEDHTGGISYRGTTRKSRRRKTDAFISDFRDLKPGDFVVHVDHGIGRFEGLQTIDTQGVEREFVLLVYAEKSKLFVPVERLDLVSRYASGENASPTLDRLGGLGWQKTKARAKREMRDMADELLRLYAERKLVSGYAFSKDAPWQKEFEDAFPYQLTPDQAISIDDVKADMEAATPMDRLIIGDVGYGKTEVAMRAAFKAVMDGKQVAVLTPTTVLSYQHFETFKERFSAFPAKVELLSRFRNRKEQKHVVEETGKGNVDVLIGTHRILSNDVAFSKLGLVIVDEEQRFGVAHKEKLKQLKKKVDVLTLSATPIPRTLNMAMTGLRDMSVIETPPRDRLAINTQVVQFSEGVIKSAIELEMSRNGQVFFIHNRVQTIEAIAAHIKRIVPNARVLVGHGQMGEKDLEKVMLDFVDYEYDVLVATTIIENGIDIPRANTMIINRADNYGLSQLYQLRGRVGRSNRRAYAYLLIPSEQELTPIARRRLSAIREFSDLGAGFRIAALDLELRGAGNILGGQQSGQMDALGFDLYTRMLNRTIQELRGEEIEDESSVSLNLGVDVSIPQDYINDTSQRLRTYKRISSTGSEEELRQIYSEVSDRYGTMPESVENLFEYARLRQTAEWARVISVDKAADGIAVKFGETSRVQPEKLMSFIDLNEGSAFSPNGILRVPVKGNDILESARMILEEVSA